MAFKKKSYTKGQAALEFMLTYGWILLVITVSVSALVYFMPSSRNLTNGKCIFGAAMPCVGTQFTSNNLTVVLKNGMGQTFYNVSANLTVPVNRACTVSNTTLGVDQRLEITCQNSGALNLNVDTRFRIEITYRKTRGGFDQKLTGDIYAKYR